jgi:hypothetical protein
MTGRSGLVRTCIQIRFFLFVREGSRNRCTYRCVVLAISLSGDISVLAVHIHLYRLHCHLTLRTVSLFSIATLSTSYASLFCLPPLAQSPAFYRSVFSFHCRARRGIYEMTFLSATCCPSFILQRLRQLQQHHGHTALSHRGNSFPPTHFTSTKRGGIQDGFWLYSHPSAPALKLKLREL